MNLTIKLKGLCALLPLAATVNAASLNRPNIIVIVADDLGYATTTVYGGNANQVKTPNIESLATTGARFTDAYVTASVCAPSRAGLITGHYQQRFGSYANFDSQRGPGVPASEVMMARYFKDAGYTTAAIGKWHLGVKEPGQHPLDRGFDKYYGFNSAQTDYLNSPILYDGKEKVTKHKYLTFQFTDEAVSFIEGAKEKPFFMYLAYNAVHGPNQAPQEYIDKYPDFPQNERVQAAMVSALDDGIGQVLETLKRTGKYENTLIFFLSDNGGLPYWWKGSNDPWQGFKREQWEGGYHVQFVMSWPSMIPAGKERNEMVSSLDILPTSMAAAGIKIPRSAHLDGTNILPVFANAEKNEIHQYLYWAGSHLPADKKFDELPYNHDNPPPTWAVRHGKWKVVQMMELGEPMLFDLEADPTESNDLAAENPQIVKQLSKKFGIWFKDMAPPIAWDKKYYDQLKTVR